MSEHIAWSLLRQVITVLKELDRYAMAIDSAARQHRPEGVTLPDIPEGLTRRVIEAIHDAELADQVRQQP